MNKMAATPLSTHHEGPLRSNKQASLRDVAYEAIKRQILRSDLKPGEALTVAGIAEALNMGRTPVIQAIDRLTVDGLLVVMPRKGVVVSPVSLDNFIEIVEIRLLNEARAVRWAAERAGSAEIAQMGANLDATWSAAKQGDIDTFIDLDREFHQMIAHAARNSVLSEFLGNLHLKALRFWFISLRTPDHTIRICEEHAAVIEGIRNRDPDKAEKAIREHISSFHANATNQILRI